MSKILFLTTAHHYDDDRIFYHQAKSLKEEGFEVKISSLSSDFSGNKDGILINSKNVIKKTSANKIDFFLTILEDFHPDCIVSSEPLAVFAAKKFVKHRRVPIIYDITEWYPSMRMLAPYKGIYKGLHLIKFLLIQILAGAKSSHFIFGEKSKRFPLFYLFPFKKALLLPYFPDQKFISYNSIQFNTKEITLAYTGQPSKEKGIENFLNAADLLQKRNPSLSVKVLIVGSTRSQKDEIFFKNLLGRFIFKDIEVKPAVNFENFTKAFSNAHICFDLRDKNFENDHCLPIKIFYYAACGKPVIYSDLKATRNAVKIDKFGYLVNPKNTLDIVKKIEAYLLNPELYCEHSANARRLFESEYNWRNIKGKFISFVKNSLE